LQLAIWLLVQHTKVTNWTIIIIGHIWLLPSTLINELNWIIKIPCIMLRLLGRLNNTAFPHLWAKDCHSYGYLNFASITNNTENPFQFYW
jgi:hypothetical protein